MSSYVADFCQDVTTGGGVLFSTILPILALFGHFWLFFAHVCIVGVLFTGPNSLVVYKKLKNIRYGSPPSASRGCGEECLCLQYTLSPLLDRTRENTTLFPIVLSIVLHGIVHCWVHCCSFFAFSCQLFPTVNLVLLVFKTSCTKRSRRHLFLMLAYF